MASFVPPFVLKHIAAEVEREIVCGSTPSEDISVKDIKAAVAALGNDTNKKEDAEVTLVSEVFRQHSNGRLLFTVEHMGRYVRKLETSFGINPSDSNACGSSFAAVVRLMESQKKKEASNKDAAKVDDASQKDLGVSYNICLLTWPISEKAGKVKMVSIAYYTRKGVATVPSDIRERGAVVSLAFDEEGIETRGVIAAAHKEQLGVFDTLLVNKDGVVYDGALSRFMCGAEGSVIVPLSYTPSEQSTIEEVLGMNVSLVGLKKACDTLSIDFRSLDITVGHLALADSIGLVSDGHDTVPVSLILMRPEDKDRINPAFHSCLLEKDGWLVITKPITPAHTQLMDKLNTFTNEKGYQLGDDPNSLKIQ